MSSSFEATNPHGARLSVDLAALGRNWQRLAARVPGAECGAVVKADAYGLGIARVVPALAKAGCETFFVAHLAEAERVRVVAPTAVIYVLNGLPAGAADAFRAIAACPVLGDAGEIAEWRESGEGGLCALHVDTGMNRLGLSVADATHLQNEGALSGLNIALALTHLVASEVEADPINARQIDCFRREVVPLFAGHHGVGISLLNSSGHYLRGAPAFDLTRPGYALYGGNPTPEAPNPMEPVVSLHASVVQCRTIEAGTTVGYNGTWQARRISRIATISVGYADGWLRSQSADGARPGGAALLNGTLVPFAGRVSMDLITLDVTDVHGEVRRGDLVTLLGDGIGVDEVAGRAGTNGYEILTSLGRRYQRHYVGE